MVIPLPLSLSLSLSLSPSPCLARCTHLRLLLQLAHAGHRKLFLLSERLSLAQAVPVGRAWATLGTTTNNNHTRTRDKHERG
jgi:hypothetical protein